jgi:hypothetical protein
MGGAQTPLAVGDACRVDQGSVVRGRWSCRSGLVRCLLVQILASCGAKPLNDKAGHESKTCTCQITSQTSSSKVKRSRTKTHLRISQVTAHMGTV